MDVLKDGQAQERAGQELRQAGAGKRLSPLDRWRPFPLECLPSPLKEYVRESAAAMGCDPSFVALPVLAAAASAIGNTRVIRLKRGWDEPSVVWSAIIGDSGTLKSPAYLKAIDWLLVRQRRLVKAWREKARKAKENVRRKGRAKGGESESKPNIPPLERFICSDTTIEKLAEILEDNPRGVLVARDELAGWLGSFSRYKGRSGGTDLPNWLEMHKAGTVVVDRKTGDRPTLFIDRAAVSVTGGIQPGVLARYLTSDLLEAGGAARLLLAMPTERPKCWTEVEVGPDTEAAYQQILDKLLALNFGQDGDGEDIPRVLRLSAEGKRAWIEFYNGWAKEQVAAEGELRAAFSKLEGYAARFALLHHVVTHVWLEVDDCKAEVGPRSIEAGATLCRWFAREARRIYATLFESADTRDRRRLVEFIETRGGSITAKDLQRSNGRKYPTADAAHEALDALSVAGLAKWEKHPPTERSGRPRAPTLILCPTPDQTDEIPAKEAEPPSESPDQMSDTIPGTPAISSETEGLVGLVGRRTHKEGHSTPSSNGNGVSSDGGVSSDDPEAGSNCPF